MTHQVAGHVDDPPDLGPVQFQCGRQAFGAGAAAASSDLVASAQTG